MDFILWQTEERFDIIIGNPPYGIIGDSSHYPIHTLINRKPLYKQCTQTWHGKFNIYAAFIEKAVRLLSDNGKLVFIVPASWLVLDDFILLRKFLSKRGGLSIYYIGKAFQNRAVSVVVMVFETGKQGLILYDHDQFHFKNLEYDGEMIRFESEESIAFERNGTSLDECFHIHFAARSPEIKKRKDVAAARINGYVPVLTGRNLHSGYIDYERCYSGYWMNHNAVASLRDFYGFPHLVVGHTKGSAVVAALDDKCYPWREEFHLIPKRDIADYNMILNYLNSKSVNDYIYNLYRDFVPHLTSRMLKKIPIPEGCFAKGEIGSGK